MPGRGPGGGPGGPNLMNMDFTEVKGAFSLNGKTFDNVGIRYKGHGTFMSSFNSMKKPFKIAFDRYDKKGRLFNEAKISLNNNSMDASKIREAIAYDLFRESGVPAPRTAFAKVYLNVPGQYAQKYLGLYTMAENVEERFLKERFGAKDGLLLKPEGASDLPYLGENWSAYEKTYAPKSKATDAAKKRLTEFLRLIHQADDPTFESRIGTILDVNEFLRFLAVNAILVNHDSLLGIGHNFYLFLNPKTDRFVFIPWDLDLSFGGFPMAGDPRKLVDLSLTHPQIGRNRLIERLMAMKSVKEAYVKIVREIVSKNFAQAKLFNEIDRIQASVRPAVASESDDALRLFNDALASAGTTKAAASTDSAVKIVAPKTDPTSRTFPAAGDGGRRGFRGPGGPFMFMPSMPLREFITERIASIDRQLDGKSQGYVPQGGFGPGGPGGPGRRPGGGFGPPPGGFGGPPPGSGEASDGPSPDVTEGRVP
jgi:spore coat protein CotH